MAYFMVAAFGISAMCVAIYQRFWIGEEYEMAFLAGCIFMAAQMVMDHVDKRSVKK